MIMIDIPMPQRCMACPCMCYVINEREDVRARCQAKVARGDKYVLVNEYEKDRPTDCPIKMGTIRRTEV